MTTQEQEETQHYFEVLKESIVAVDDFIEFAGSEAGNAYFGVDTAKGIVEHLKEIKKAGAKYCDCPACHEVEQLLALK